MQSCFKPGHYQSQCWCEAAQIRIHIDDHVHHLLQNSCILSGSVVDTPTSYEIKVTPEWRHSGLRSAGKEAGLEARVDTIK